MGYQFPDQGLKPCPLGLEAQSLDQWTTRKSKLSLFDNKKINITDLFLKKVLTIDLCAWHHANWTYNSKEIRRGHRLHEA